MYGLEAEDSAALCRTLSEQIYKGLESPSMLCSRYLREDVPLRLVPLAELAGLAEIEVPVINVIIDLASVVCGRLRMARTSFAGLGDSPFNTGLRILPW